MSFKKLLPIFFVMLSFGAKANYMLVQNVTKLGNNPTNKTIQIQFDLSWQNSWRDSINWDAAWIFIKFKDANGLWQHARINLAGFANGAGTSNTIKVGSDSVGAFVYRSALGSGNFNATSMQLQWNYGASGLTDGSGLEVRVFATEMVYVPEGDFNVEKRFYFYRNGSLVFFPRDPNISAPGNNFPVINNRLTPTITYNDGGGTLRIKVKGDAGIDINNDGVVDNTNYPTGYKPFYSYKYELSEQQYADFLNTLTTIQKANLGVAGYGITINNGAYFSSSPNRACNNATSERILSYADWSGLRPMSILEFNKASYGPLPVLNLIPAYFDVDAPELNNVGSNATSTSSATESGGSYYGVMDLTGNAIEPCVSLNFFNFNELNGNGVLSITGNSDNVNWDSNMIIGVDRQISQGVNGYNFSGFRYVRSAE